MFADIHDGRCFVFLAKDRLINFAFNFMVIFKIVGALLDALDKTAFLNKVSGSEVFG